MISEKYNYLFVHRGKSGGNSISEALLPFSEAEKVVDPRFQDGIDRFGVVNRSFGTTKHSTLADYKQLVPAEIFDRLYKFTILRNPYDRLVSAFFAPHRVAEGLSTAFSKDRFIDLMRQQHTLRHMICLSDDEPITAHMHTILRFEHLNEDFAALCKQLCIPATSLPHRNKGTRRPYQEYYDQDTIAVVERLFGEELELGQYSF